MVINDISLEWRALYGSEHQWRSERRTRCAYAEKSSGTKIEYARSNLSLVKLMRSDIAEQQAEKECC